MTNPSVKLNRCLTLLVQEGSAAGTVIIATNKRAKSSSKKPLEGGQPAQGFWCCGRSWRRGGSCYRPALNGC